MVDLPESAYEDVVIEAGPITLHGLARAYAEVEPGAVMAIAGSSGFLEIARNMGRADDIQGLSLDVQVRVRLKA